MIIRTSASLLKYVSSEFNMKNVDTKQNSTIVRICSAGSAKK